MNNETQIVKGILEGCILKIIAREKTYGYKAVEYLNHAGFEVNEATVYPILLRLQKKGLLIIEKASSPLGPPRKYYYLSKEGLQSLKEFQETWNKLKTVVEEIMEDKIHEKNQN